MNLNLRVLINAKLIFLLEAKKFTANERKNKFVIEILEVRSQSYTSKALKLESKFTKMKANYSVFMIIK